MKNLRDGLRSVEPIVLLIIPLTLLHWVELLRSVPILRSIRGWMWYPTSNPAGSLWLIVALLAAPALVLWLVFWKIQGRPGLKVFLLVVLGYGLQVGLGMTEGRGLDAIRDRMVTAGHAEFATIAVGQHDAGELIREYEALLDKGELGKYAHSKPPGQLLLYVATERVSSYFAADASETSRLESLRTFAAIVWPMVSMLALIPLYVLASSLMNPVKALLACSFYVFVPAVQLITLHTDQVFYPAFFVLACCLSVRALVQLKPAHALLAGAVIYLCVFCSFALVWVLPVIACVGAGLWLESRVHRARLALTAMAIFLGFAAMTVLVWGIFGYNMFVRYEHAMAYHHAWRAVDHGFVSLLRYCLTNFIEFAVWVGVPLFILSFYGELRAIIDITEGQRNALVWLTAGLLVTMAGVALVGETIAEIARLWLFFVPLVCLVAADVFLRINASMNRWYFFCMFLLQFGTMYFTKRFQDFW